MSPRTIGSRSGSISSLSSPEFVIGTQVNNWNQARLDSRGPAEYRARLVIELDFDARQYAQQTAYYPAGKGLWPTGARRSRRHRAPERPRFPASPAYQLTQIDTTRAKTDVYEEMAAVGLTDRLETPRRRSWPAISMLSVEVAQRMLETALPYRTLLRRDHALRAPDPYPAIAAATGTSISSRQTGRNHAGRPVPAKARSRDVLRHRPGPSSRARPQAAHDPLHRLARRKAFNVDLAGRQALDLSQAPDSRCRGSPLA